MDLHERFEHQVRLSRRMAIPVSVTRRNMVSRDAQPLCGAEFSNENGIAFGAQAAGLVQIAKDD